MRELLANITCPLCGGTRSDTLLVVIDGPAQITTVRAQCVRCHLFWSFTLDSQLSLRAPVATREEHATGPITAAPPKSRLITVNPSTLTLLTKLVTAVALKMAVSVAPAAVRLVTQLS